MDTDQIMAMLMQMQVDDARRDERQQNMAASLEKLLAFKEIRVKAVDEALDDIRKRNSEFERRLSAIEGKGMFAWSPKLLAQWGGLIVLGGGVFAVANKLWQWLMSRLQF